MLTRELANAERIAPRFIEPMYAQLVRELPDGEAWCYEAKLDGYRCLAAKRNGEVVFWSRRGNLFTSRFPTIAKACEQLTPETLVDGEVVAVDENGRCSFNALQHFAPTAELQFYAFDLLVYRSRSVMNQPLDKRRELLDEALTKVEYPVLKCQFFNAKPADVIRAAKALGMEGVIAKRKGSFYESGKRSGAWQKYKINKSQEFVIGGYTPGNPLDALIVGVYDGDRLNYVAKVRAGFVPHLRREIYDKLKALEVKTCPFANLPERRRTQWALTAEEMKECHWLKPVKVAQIEFTEWTPDGHLRHSSFAGLRDDKQAREVRRE